MLAASETTVCETLLPLVQRAFEDRLKTNTFGSGEKEIVRQDIKSAMKSYCHSLPAVGQARSLCRAYLGDELYAMVIRELPPELAEAVVIKPNELGLAMEGVFVLPPPGGKLLKYSTEPETASTSSPRGWTPIGFELLAAVSWLCLKPEGTVNTVLLFDTLPLGVMCDRQHVNYTTESAGLQPPHRVAYQNPDEVATIVKVANSHAKRCLQVRPAVALAIIVGVFH